MLLERRLADLQENICKLQLVLPEGAALPEGLDVVHESVSGRLRTLIVRGSAGAATERAAAAGPIYLDAVPLNLEEIFIYELGGEGHEVREIML